MISEPIPGETYCHKKGGIYTYLHTGRNETHGETVAIYQSQNGDIWVRDYAEFRDGRFTLIKHAPCDYDVFHSCSTCSKELTV